MRIAWTGAAWALLIVAGAAPAAASAQAFDSLHALPDPELRAVTGKFILPNGAEIALTVVSQTLVDNQLVLRTVFKVDTSTSIQVFGRNGAGTDRVFAGTPTASQAAAGPTGVSVSFDRHSGTSIITPTYSVAPATTVTLGDGAVDDAASWGLMPIAVAAGAPAVATVDGTVTLASLPRGALVTLAGDQFTVSHLIGNAIASIVSNTANDRTIDTVTNVNIDLRDVSAYVAGSAALRVDALALDAARGVVR